MKGGKRLNAGRKAINIDLVELEKLSSIQCTDPELAAILEVSVRTIERRKKQPEFAETIERGRARGRVSVRRMLFAQGAKGNIAAVIFLAKNLLGYKDRVANELSGPDGGPIAMGPAPELGGLNDEELRQLRFLVGKTQPPGKH